MIKMVWAQELNGGLGYQGKLAWHLPQELCFFKTLTLNQVVIMGYGTFLSLPKPLVARANIVLSANHAHQQKVGFHFCQSVEQIKKIFTHSDLYVIGGKKTYASFWNDADELIVSKINQSFLCDVYMDLSLTDFALTKIEKYDGFNVEYYCRKG